MRRHGHLEVIVGSLGSANYRFAPEFDPASGFYFPLINKLGGDTYEAKKNAQKIQRKLSDEDQITLPSEERAWISTLSHIYI